MATVNYSTVPATVTITNNTPQRAVNDPGAKVLGLQYAFDDVEIQLFQINEKVLVKRGDSLVLRIETSEEAAYYASLANDNIGVAIAQIVPPEDASL